jgi:hypothetical protein
MRVTRENVQEFIQIADELISALESAKEACETWDGLQDEERNEEIADEIRTAREDLDAELEGLDVSSACQLIHGKHKGK